MMRASAVIVCVIFSSALVFAAPPEIPQKVKDAHTECQANPNTHVDDSVFKAVNRGEPFDRALVGAHMLCMSTKLGTQNADGTVNKEVVRKVFSRDLTDEAKIEELTNKCAKEGPTPAETALELGKCIRENTSHGKNGHVHGHHHH